MAERLNYEILDHNIAAGYVSYIVEMWNGDDRTALAAEVNQYLFLWDAENEIFTGPDDVALDPDFGQVDRYGEFRPENRAHSPLVSQKIRKVKEADRDALNFEKTQRDKLDPEGYRGYGSSGTDKDMYVSFMDAIDAVGQNEDDEAAWQKIDAWFTRRASLMEK